MSGVLRLIPWGAGVLVAVAAALFIYFVYAPAPEIPPLSGTLTPETIQAGGRTRTFLTYLPRGMNRGAPLVVAMHGSGQNGAAMRRWTGYGFDRLADRLGFAVAYPDGFEGYWNACNIVGDYGANALNVDDVGFLTAMLDKLVAQLGIDPARVFATGISRGGQMTFRLALEAPARFRAVAAVAASVPTTDNLKCRPAGHGTSSVLIMNGTRDPLNPFEGGEVTLFGFVARGTVRSSRESGSYFANLNGISGPPGTSETDVNGDTRAEHLLWRNGSGVEVELVAIRGGGHGMPQPYWRPPRILGPAPTTPNGPALIWQFFERQGRPA